MSQMQSVPLKWKEKKKKKKTNKAFIPVNKPGTCKIL